MFEQWLDQLRLEFAERVIDVGVEVADRWGRMNAVRSLPAIDGLLAATAIEHGLTLVTRDSGALAGSGVRILDPWV